jgi:dihydrofolate reductase
MCLEEMMRKIILFMNVSLDGYIEGPGHDISGFTNDFEAFSSGQSVEVDVLLFGRRTYEMMKFWSTPQAGEMAPEVAKFMNAKAKVVVSHSAFDPGWDMVTVITGDVISKVKALKEQPGKNIMIFGSNTLCTSLVQEWLIDEIQVVVNPVVFGEGTSLFRGLSVKTALVLTNTRKFKSGSIMLTYTPVER